jgi:hypothetical protein
MQSDLICAERNAASASEVEEFAAEPLATGRPVVANDNNGDGPWLLVLFLTIGTRRVETWSRTGA